MSRSIAASTVRRRARVPSRWPASAGSPRAAAQRLFPSMMIATDRGPSPTSRVGARRRIRERRFIATSRRKRGVLSPVLDLGDLGFFALQEVVDLLDVFVGELLDALLGAALVVGPDALLLLEVVDHVAADVPHGDPSVLCDRARHLDELLAALLGQLRDRQADDLAVVRGVQAKVGFLDR